MTRPLDVARWPPWLRERPGSPVSAETPSGAVTFPTTHLVTRVQIALGADLTQPSNFWVWADITSYVRQDLGISWSTGRPDGSGQVGYGSARLKLDNRDGRFSRRNPNSPYFGLLTRNTPIWVTLDAGSGVRDRIQMFVNEWPVRWSDESATDSTVTIQCSGALRRLGQAATITAAMRRAVLGKTQPTPAGYWPCEDPSGSLTVASGLSGGRPNTSGTPAFGAGFGGSTGSLDLSGADETAPAFFAPVSSASGFQVEVIFQVPSGGTAFLFNLQCGTFGVVSGVPIGISGALADGEPHHLALSCVQNGGNVDVTSYSDGVRGATTPVAGVLDTNAGVLTRGLNPSGTLLAHIVIYNFADIGAPTTRAPAADAYAGELATTRIRRLCGEESVPIVCTSGASVAMGPQPVGKLLDLLRDAEAVDQGVLYETAWGLGFQACNDRTNMPVSLALDYNQRHIADTPEPADDDQRLRNRWTLSRSGGSTALPKELTTGQTGTTLAGVYDGSATVNVQLDTQLLDQAGWRLNIGTPDEDRWPSIPMNFTRTPTLIDTWTMLPFGQRMTVSNLPAQMPPDMLDLVIEGFSEAWTPYNYYASVSSSPFSPYRVGTLAQDTGDTAETLLILTPDTLILAADVNTTDTSWSINSSPVWTTNSEMFPRRIMWEGEEIRLTNCSGASAPQTWTVVRSVNGVVKAHLANSTGKILNPGRLALA